MANVQKQFEKFHETIRTDFNTNKELRDKRDIILDKISSSLVEARRPTFERLMQGSYIMRTGVFPLGGRDYDIDVGLRFKIAESDYNATEVRTWVLDAISKHTKDVKPKGPCIRVRYSQGFHVDLVVYACWDDVRGVGQFRLAHDPSGWIPADPVTLLAYVDEQQKRFSDTEGGTQTTQLRRVIRYLKRWDDFWQPEESDAKPSGLAFTLLSIAQLSPTVSWDGRPDDRSALRTVANYARYQTRLEAKKPTPQYDDVFGKLSDSDMRSLITRFGTLCDTLDAAEREPDPTKACALLAAIFGDDFPVPPPDDMGEKTKAPAIVTSSASG